MIQRLASLGLISHTASRSSRQPSFVPPFLPGLLTHLHPPTNSALPPYPPSYFPSILLPLSASTLAHLLENLLQHLPSKLVCQTLEPGTPSGTVRRLVDVLIMVVGPLIVGEEAWMATLRCVSGRTTYGTPLGEDEHLRARIVVGWFRAGGESGKWTTILLCTTAVFPDDRSLHRLPQSCHCLVDRS